ncbi:MAG: hypothetical protein AAB458_02730 [Patescibacteria group bacterium]
MGLIRLVDRLRTVLSDKPIHKPVRVYRFPYPPDRSVPTRIAVIGEERIGEKDLFRIAKHQSSFLDHTRLYVVCFPYEQCKGFLITPRDPEGEKERGVRKFSVPLLTLVPNIASEFTEVRYFFLDDSDLYEYDPITTSASVGLAEPKTATRF